MHGTCCSRLRNALRRYAIPTTLTCVVQQYEIAVTARVYIDWVVCNNTCVLGLLERLAGLWQQQEINI